MSARSGLPRIAAVYELLEQRRSVELRAAALAVEEAEQTIAAERAAQRTEAALGRTALAVGDRERWLVAESTYEIAQMRMQRLNAAREECIAALEEATVAHRESRLKREQIARVLESERVTCQVDDARRTQQESDDRYGARLGWRRMKAR